MAKDLVCGMEVDKKTPAAKIDYDGQTFYFCSENCKKQFVEEPEKYIPKEAGEHHHHQ